MSDPGPVKSAERVGAAAPTAKKPTGFSNPALRAMGIPVIKLPSRNWMIFWSVLAAGVGGVAFDKYKQRRVIAEYTDSVRGRAEAQMPVDRLPRKVTVFIAPPPNDYLDTSLKLWRRYVKPILFYAGVDYNVVDEDRQGVIRTYVANEMRSLRRQRIVQQQQGLNPAHTVIRSESDSDDEAGDPHFRHNFDFRKIVGIFYKKPPPQEIISEDAQTEDARLSGGVICLGRGAYKEYINGLHEGLLGPLDPPEPAPETETNSTDPPSNMPETNTGNVKPSSDGQVSLTDAAASLLDDLPEKNAESAPETPTETAPEVPDTKVLKPFISPDDYAAVETPPAELPELGSAIIRDPKTHVPILLHQAVLVIPVPNLIGFLTIPERIYRFYLKRRHAEEVCSEVTQLVNQSDVRPFQYPTDLALGKGEEQDWPKRWVKQGQERGSEWIQELRGDERITGLMSVYNNSIDTSDEE
ncbi:Tim22-complex subunit TIM54 KNAG_0E02630 [Huiozyma naganishii CBS 8797]|uniref:Mitochondrial import inner membrane translocase subunit TIM54 n=1 Tax=Huiozyma naganishii (strain ATCC MYA-139 / BCRC 22969 / CBS 8797 / KCTC 17520 / NBRC 10181 / NCYC 3082 / Yp74L-3) TaxID=1071383 RepID=J7RZA1_HUIN7|nr:hypothetical protein KNAG_0E02630 [Kazachstania naganishii CBS 8797]CCK70522.1 hypothetical protein KNAG_0E02630 [Kazachstania naganishii CBS 8797]